MKLPPFMSIAMVASMLCSLCSCSGNKNTNETEFVDNDTIQSTAVQDSLKADSIAKVEAAEAAKLDPEAMKAVVKKLFNTSGVDELLALMSSSWRAKYEKRCRNVDFDLLSSGGDESVEEGSLKITSADPVTGTVKATATLAFPDPEAEDYEGREKASYTFKVVREGDKHLIDYCDFKTANGGLVNGGFDL